jgi:hypothetical protein
MIGGLRLRLMLHAGTTNTNEVVAAVDSIRRLDPDLVSLNILETAKVPKAGADRDAWSFTYWNKRFDQMHARINEYYRDITGVRFELHRKTVALSAAREKIRKLEAAAKGEERQQPHWASRRVKTAGAVHLRAFRQVGNNEYLASFSATCFVDWDDPRADTYCVQTLNEITEDGGTRLEWCLHESFDTRKAAEECAHALAESERKKKKA